MKILKQIIFIILIALGTQNAFGYTSESCIECHSKDSGKSKLTISMEAFNASVHAQEDMECLDCHSSVTDESHEKMGGTLEVDCSECHEQDNIHGENAAKDLQPQCYSCHTRHDIRTKDDVKSSVHPEKLTETCQSCHPVQSGKTGLLSNLTKMQVKSHAKQDFSLVYDRTNCLGCHQGKAAHGESEVINDQNCQTCHLNDEGESALWGYIHPDADLEKHSDVFFAGVIQAVFIILIIFGGFGMIFRRRNQDSKGD